MKASVKIFIGASVVLAVINILWFLSSGAPLETESPVRFVLGGLLIFLLPGLLWGEVLGFRSDHPLETAAISFALTLAIEVVFLPVPFLFHATIRLWLWLLLASCLTGAGILFHISRKGRATEFLNPLLNFFHQPLLFKVSTSGLVAIIILMSYGVYHWGENIFDVDGEKLIHFTFIRYYLSLPLALPDLALTRGYPPPNLLYLWEFLIAAWSSLVHTDPLVLAYRARFVIPVLGISALFALIKNIFLDRAKSEAVLWGILFMCLGWFGLLSPSHLDWIKTDPTRGLMSFMGMVHHGDSAMEILIPLNAALILFAFRERAWRSLLLLAGVLSASFLWHTREFFQAMLYFVIFGISLLLMPSGEKRLLLKKWVIILAVFIAVIVFFSVLMASLVPAQSYGYDDLKLKKFALSYAIQHMTDIRSLFHFPVDLRLTHGLNRNAIVTNIEILGLFENSWSYFLWLILSALAVPVLVLLGDRNDRHLSLFFMLLWFLTLCWGFSQFMLIALTYSEILFTTPRMIYLFSYILIAAAFYSIFRSLGGRLERRGNLLLCFVGLFAAGILVKLWWDAGVPFGRTASVALGVIFSGAFLVTVFSGTPAADGKPPVRVPAVVLGILVFFLPILAQGYGAVIPSLLTKGRPAVAWFNDGNPFGFSKELIRFIRTLPPGATVELDPLGNAAVSLYAPLYAAVPPQIMGMAVVTAREAYREAAAGENPLFRRQAAGEAALPDHGAVRKRLDQHGADLILAEGGHYPGLRAYFVGYPETYVILFDNPGVGELVVRYRRTGVREEGGLRGGVDEGRRNAANPEGKSSALR